MADIRSLEIFYWVAQLQSFSKAAEKLNTTQPAVSQRVASLESEFGVKLIDRSPRSISLTAKGRILADYAERFLRLRSSMVNAVAEPEAMTGLLRLGVSETIAQTWLARFMERAHAVYPNIVIDITVDVSPEMRHALVNRELDLAFLLGPVSEPTMLSEHLCSYPIRFVAARDLAIGREPLSKLDILKYPIVTFPKATYPYTYLREILSIPDLPPPRIFSSSSLSTIIRMTLDRIGLSVMPPDIIPNELANGELRVVATELVLPDLVFTATYPMALDGGLAAPLARLACEIARDDQAGRHKPSL